METVTEIPTVSVKIKRWTPKAYGVEVPGLPGIHWYPKSLCGIQHMDTYNPVSDVYFIPRWYTKKVDWVRHLLASVPVQEDGIYRIHLDFY